MDAPRPPRRRWFHWQYSLRALLVLMLVLGVAISVYRWPWEVVKVVDREYLPTMAARRVMTYRRDWRGKPVKHGPERLYLEGALIEEEMYYDGQLHGLCRCFDPTGKLTEERTFRGGIQHGPFRIGDGKTWVQSGHYDFDQKDGDWRVLNAGTADERDKFIDAFVVDGEVVFSDRPRHKLDPPQDPIETRQQWRHGARHGRWEWRTLSGELLYSAEYANDQLTKWNDDDAPARFWSRLNTIAAADQALRDHLAKAPIDLTNVHSFNPWEKPVDVEFVLLERLRLWHPLRTKPLTTYLDVQYAVTPLNGPLVLENQSLGANLLEHALREGLDIDYRYGSLWLVPADEVTGCHDTTGVDLVRFPAGSSQAREWEEPIAAQIASPFHLPRINHIMQGTSICLDFQALVGNFTVINVGDPGAIHGRRTRRDALGLALYRAGLQCEREGTKLVIKPHWTKR